MSITKTFLALGILMALTSCSDTPSASQARTKLENDIQQQSKGLIKVVSFDKTDGVKQEFMGTKGYQLSYSAEIEFIDDCLWNGGHDTGGWGGAFEAVRGQPQTGFGAFAPGAFGKQAAKKGQHQKISGSMGFTKTERGWN